MLISIHRATKIDCKIMNLYELIPLATESAKRCPIVDFSMCFSCQVFVVFIF